MGRAEGAPPPVGVTDFESRTHPELLDILDGVSGASARMLAGRLSDAAVAINAIGCDLKAHMAHVRWEGEGGDAFRDWGHRAAMATLELGAYSQDASSWLAEVAAAINTAKSAAPERPSAPRGEGRAESARLETARQLRRLAQTYTHAGEQLGALRPPEFPPPTGEFAPPGSAGEERKAPVRTETAGAARVPSPPVAADAPDAPDAAANSTNSANSAALTALAAAAAGAARTMWLPARRGAAGEDEPVPFPGGGLARGGLDPVAGTVTARPPQRARGPAAVGGSGAGLPGPTAGTFASRPPQRADEPASVGALGSSRRAPTADAGGAPRGAVVGEGHAWDRPPGTGDAGPPPQAVAPTPGGGAPPTGVMPFTPGGSGLVGAAPVGGGRPRDRESGERPGPAVAGEDENTWRRGARPVVPPVIE